MLLAIYLPATLLAICDGLLIPTLPLYADGFGASVALIGLVLAAEGTGTLIADLPAGRLLSGMRVRSAMILGTAVVAVAVLGAGLAPNLGWLLVSRLVSGTGLAIWNVSRHAFLVGATHGANRGRMMSVLGGLTRLGGFAGPAVGGLLAAALGLRAPFVLYAVVALATVGLLALALPAGAESRPSRVRSTGARSEELAARRAATPGMRMTLLNAGGAQLLGQAVRTGRRVLVPLYAAQVLGLDVGVVGLIVSASYFADMSLFYPAGLIMDRLGRKFAIVPSFALQAVGMMLVPLTTGATGLTLAALLMGVGNGISAGTMLTLGADLAPRNAVLTFLGWWRLIGDAGFVAGPLITGAVAAGLGLGPSALVIGALGAGAAAWFAFGVPETLRRSWPGAEPAAAAAQPATTAQAAAQAAQPPATRSRQARGEE